MSWRHHKGSRHARGYGSAWVTLRGQALERDGHLCQACLAIGRPALATQVDHKVPKAKGGSDDLTNLQSLCGPCHDAKTARDQGRKTRRQVGLDGYPV